MTLMRHDDFGLPILDDEAKKQRALAEAAKFLRVSYSSLGTESGCARKFEFQKLYPQRERMFDSFAADVGTALHRGFQNYLVHQDSDYALWELTRAYPVDSEYHQANDFRSLEACASTLLEMIDSTAFGEYELAQIVHPLSGQPVPAIEVPFEIQFAGTGGLVLPDGRRFAFVGFMDAILRNKNTGAYRTMDIKTHRRALKDATANYVFNGQQIPYGIMIEQVLGQEGSVDSFDVLYLDTYVDLLEPRVEEYVYAKHREDITEWLTNTVMQMQNIAKYAGMDYFPRTSGGCMSWNRPCYWMDVCNSRNRDAIEKFILMNEEPAIPRYELPWIVAEIDPFS